MVGLAIQPEARQVGEREHRPLAALAQKGGDGGQVGVVAVIGGEPVAVDLFDKPETLDAYWEAIISGYALDGLDAEETPADTAAVSAFIDQLDQVVEEPVRAVGLGDEIHFESDQVAGAAQRWDEVLVHLSAYSLAGMA